MFPGAKVRFLMNGSENCKSLRYFCQGSLGNPNFYALGLFGCLVVWLPDCKLCF